MKVQNGTYLYEKNEKPPIPKDLNADLEVYSPYGFKVIEIDGKEMWAVATEKEYREAVAQLRGISPDAVSLDESCHNTGPQTCSSFCGTTAGFCTLAYNPALRYYYCTCN